MKGLWPLLMTLAASTDDKPWDSEPVQIAGREHAMYMRGDSGEVIECSGGNRDCGALGRDGFTSSMILFWDCSDAKFDCLFNGTVLAVPRAGLAPGQTYTVFGANLTVERCFGRESRCDIARVRSECAIPAFCSCLPGRTAVFYYSPQFGITSFYSMPEPPSVFDPKFVADAIPLFTFTLIAKEGFLHASLNHRKATCAGS